MSHEDASDQGGSRPRLRVSHAVVFLLLTISLCGISFVAGRLTIERTSDSEESQVSTIKSQAVKREPVKPKARTTTNEELKLHDIDMRRFEEILGLSRQVTDLGWELIAPVKEFEAGAIDADALQKRTAKPDFEVMRLSTRMYELSNEIDDPEIRKKTVSFTEGVLQRQGGFSMMLQGMIAANESQIAQGAKLFEEGRNKALAAVISFVKSDDPRSATLRRLLEAHQASRQ